MVRNTFLLRVVSAMAISLAIASFPGLGFAASPLSLPPAGMGSVVLVNQDGGNEVLSVNFAGTTYTVAPQNGTSSNQVEFNISPGTYSYVASVAGIGSVNGSVTIPQDHVISLAFIDNTADLAGADQNADDQAVVTQQVVSNNNDDENNEGDNDNDHENNEGESSSVQNVENDTHQEFNESGSTEAAEHDSVAKSDDGVQVDPAKGKIVVPDAAKVTTNTVDPSKGKIVVPDAAKGKIVVPNAVKVTTPDDAAKGKIVIPNTGKITVPLNPGKINNFSTNVGKPNVTTNATNHMNTNSPTNVLCVPGSPIFPACDKVNNGHSNGSNGKGGKKGDILTISFTPADSGMTTAIAAGEGKNKNHDSDDDDEGSETTTTVTNVVTSPVDNDELLVTVTDVTAQAQ